MEDLDWNKLIQAKRKEATRLGLEVVGIGMMVSGTTCTDLVLTSEYELRMNLDNRGDISEDEIVKRIAHSKLEDCNYAIEKRSAEYNKGTSYDTD